MTTVAVVGVIPTLFALDENPLRVIPVSVAVGFCVCSSLLKRAGRARAATWLLAGAIGITCVLAMLLNGGLRAPAAVLVLPLVSTVGWLAGWRAAGLSAVACVLWVVAIALASEGGLLREQAPPPPLLHASFFAMYIALAWVTTAVPQRQLRIALLDAANREAAVRVAEQHRIASEIAFKNVFDNTHEVVVVASMEGQVLHVNRAANDFLGTAPAGLGSPQVLSSYPGWGDLGRRKLEEALERVRSGSAASFELPRGSAHFELTLTLLSDAVASSSNVLLEGRDVSGLLESEQHEARARRLGVIGQLAASVAHDFNNVLAVVMTSTEILRAELEEDGALRGGVAESLDAIVTSSQRASDLTRRLLVFSRQQPRTPKPTSMHEFLGSTVKLLTRLLPPRIVISTQLDAPRDAVVADVASLESALLNLAINARDAMPGPGSLTLSTACVEPDDVWKSSGGSSRWAATFLRVCVSDTGTGIPKALQAKLFEPFVTTKPEGTGIGLASVFSTMHEHGGAVSLRSEEGHGTEFYLEFPLHDGPVVPARTSTAAPPWFGGCRALLVDDEPALLRMVERLLQGLGFATVVARDAEAGLGVFLQSPVAFDIAMLDVALPGRQGGELALDLLQRSDSLKVVLMSGFHRDGELSALPNDRVRFLSKPFAANTLSRLLAELLPAPYAAATPDRAHG